MRALVTGAAGFIGSTLCDHLLNAGHDVLGVDSFSDYYRRQAKERNLASARNCEHFDLIEADLLNANVDALLMNIEVVFHLAAYPGVRSSWGSNFQDYLATNVLVTQRLLEAARAHDLSRFVYSSSSSVYGAPDHYPSAEGDVARPLSPYGVTKLAGEQLCMLYHKNFGVPAVSLRYFTVYGPRQRPDMAIERLVRAALNGSRFEMFGDGTQIRDFTFVDDVVQANVLAATKEPAVGETINVGGGSAISMIELVEMIQELTGRPIDLVRQSAAKGDVPRTQSDVTRSQQLLNWAPSIGLAYGLAKQIEFDAGDV